MPNTRRHHFHFREGYHQILLCHPDILANTIVIMPDIIQTTMEGDMAFWDKIMSRTSMDLIDTSNKEIMVLFIPFLFKNLFIHINLCQRNWKKRFIVENHLMFFIPLTLGKNWLCFIHCAKNLPFCKRKQILKLEKIFSIFWLT